jgi:acetyl-CoA carboxylase carboxyl transferase subunit beta
MSWFEKVPPKIRALVGKTNVPDNLWHQCSACSQMIFHRELDANQMVCPNCGHHMRLTAAKRLAALFDNGAFDTVAVPDVPADPLKFRDRKRYSDRLKEARTTKGANDAIIVAVGQILGHETVVAVFDFQFMGGSMGIAVGEGFLAAADQAIERQAPLIVIPSSGGARMQEGILSLMQMPRTVIAVQKVKEAGLPYIVILTDPTTGGVSASFAMLGDIAIAEPGAVIGFAGARVIEETIREQLPKGFQRAEYLLEHGMIDMVVPRQQLPKTLARVIDLLKNPERRAGADKDAYQSGGGSAAE